MSIGVELEPMVLVLTRDRDFKWAFINLNANRQPEEFPAGELFIEFPDLIEAGEPKRWHFVIDGERADIKIEHDEVNSVPARARWQLVWMPDGEEEGGDPVALGRVQVQGAA